MYHVCLVHMGEVRIWLNAVLLIVYYDAAFWSLERSSRVILLSLFRAGRVVLR